MDTNYNEFNYQNDFQYNYNIFKNNYNIGIGTSIPKHNLDIHGNLSSSNNINIDGSLLLNKNNLSNLILLEYNVNTTQVSPLKLINQSNTLNNNSYNWIHDTNNNNLELKFHNKNDNTIIPFQSVPYKTSDENIILYSKYDIIITHAFLYKLSQSNNIEYTVNTIQLNFDSNNYILSSTNNYDCYYKFNNNIVLNKNTENNLIISDSSNVSSGSSDSSINLNTVTTVSVIEDQAPKFYYFNGVKINDNTFNVSTGTTYNLNDIPYDYPLAILHDNNITVNEANTNYNNSESFSLNIISNENIYNGLYEFYFNDIEFKIPENSIFHDDVSIASTNNSFCGAKNIFRYKTQNENEHYDDLTSLSTNNIINSITSDNSVTISAINSIYKFNDDTITKFYLLKDKQYIFKNIPASHPLGFVSSNNTFTSKIHVIYNDNNVITDTYNIKYYHGDISFIVTSSFFNDTISIKCKNHGYMGGQDLFEYKNDNILLTSYNVNHETIKIVVDIDTTDSSNYYQFNFNSKSYSFRTGRDFDIIKGETYYLDLSSLGSNHPIGLLNSNDITILSGNTYKDASGNVLQKLGYKYYTDYLEFRVNSDANISNVSIYCYNHGEMGTSKLQIIESYDELPYNDSINTIDVTIDSSSGSNYYSFNNSPLNTVDKYYVSNNEFYTLLNISDNHPLGFLDSINSIVVYSDKPSISHTVNSVNYNFYTGNITFKINKSFADDISIYCKNHGYMGGKYLLRSKDYDDNIITDLPTQEITVSFNQGEYKFHLLDDTELTNTKYFISPNIIYTFKTIPSIRPLTILSDNITFSKYIYTLSSTNNGVTTNYTCYYGNLQFTVSDNFTNLSIDSYNSDIVLSSNVLVYSSNIYNNYIILLGKYNFNSGLLWNNNKDEDLLFINNNVGIGTTNIFKTQLYINDSAISTNTHVYNKIHSYNSEINTVNTNHSRINKITSNELTINKTNNNLGIGTNKTNDFLNIGNELVISHNKNTYLNNLSFLNNINFKNNINILYKNKPFIIFNNNNNEFSYKLNNIQKSANKLFILNNINVNPINDNYLNNNGNILNIYGNLNVTENVSVQGSLKINNQKNIFIQKKINVINFKNNTQLFNKGFTYAKYITTQNSKTHYLKVPYKSNTSEPGVLYYDNVNDTFIGNDGNNIKFLSDDQINSRKTIFDYKFNGLTQLLYTNSRHVNTNNINVTKRLILPKTDTFTKNNLDITLVGNMRFNINTLYTQIHDGYKWCSIKYNNTESQLNYLSFDNLSDLQPSFHNRRLNYEYTSFIKPTFLTLSINPYSVLNVIFKSSNLIVNQTTINNTNPTHLSQNIDITNDVLGDFNLIEFNSTKNNTVIDYTCSFSYISNQLQQFISKYEFFNIKTTSESHNIFKLVSSVVPTNLVYNNMFQPNLTNIQLISGQNVYTDDSLYRDDLENIFYDRSDKTFTRNYHNKLYNLNYTTQTKFKLVFIKNLIHNKIKLFEDDLLNTLSNVVYNEESEQLTKIEYSMEYNIVYHNDLFIKSFSSVILNTPIVNSNNKINYRIINSSREIKYDYKELFEEDLISTDYNTTSYEIYYDSTDDAFYMEHISNSHKFNIIGNVDSVVVGLEYLTCQFKQFVAS